MQTEGRDQMRTTVSVPKEVATRFKLREATGVPRFGINSDEATEVSVDAHTARQLTTALRDRELRSAMYQAAHCLPV